MISRVLIVDDSPAMRSLVRRVLVLSGFPHQVCAEAGNGKEALEDLQQHGAGLVLTDVNMPVMDGETLVRALRADSRLASIPVVVVSTDGTRQRRERLRELGVRGYLTKPFHRETLRWELERALEVS